MYMLGSILRSIGGKSYTTLVLTESKRNTHGYPTLHGFFKKLNNDKNDTLRIVFWNCHGHQNIQKFKITEDIIFLGISETWLVQSPQQPPV